MKIRLASEDDAAAVAAIYAPFCETRVTSFEVSAPSREEMANRIRATTAQCPWLVMDDDGEVVGYAYAGRHHERAAYQWAVNTAVYIGDRYQGRGVGRALYAALFELLRAQGYFKACAGITLPNPASVGLHDAMGFQLVGVYRGIGHKFGGWHDVAWYELVLQPERSNPAPPTPVAGMKDALEIMLEKSSQSPYPVRGGPP